MGNCKVPEKYGQYDWISKRLQKIKGVNFVGILKEGDELIMIASNGKTGAQKKDYVLPLRTNMVIDYTIAPNCPHDYDIMDLDNPQAMVEVAYAKAHLFFNDETIH